MSMSHCILLDHVHIGDQHIPSFVDSFCLVLLEHQHVTLQTARSGPHWRSTHPFLCRFVSLSTTRLWSRHVAYSSNDAHIGDQHILSFVDSFCLVLQDYKHIMLHTPPSCPYWKWTYHPFLRRFHLLSTTKWWACHIANSSIMPTFKSNTSFPSSIRFA
jgi:hypothetical protein